MSHDVSLHLNQVIGSGIPTTDTSSRGSELRGGSGAPGWEPYSLCLCPGNATLRRGGLRAAAPLRGHAGRIQPAARGSSPGCCCRPSPEPSLQDRSPGDEEAARPARRCIRAGRRRLGARCVSPGLWESVSQAMLLPSCSTTNTHMTGAFTDRRKYKVRALKGVFG